YNPLPRKSCPLCYHPCWIGCLRERYRMANEEQLAILKQGVEVWNKWREENPDAKVDLFHAELENINLSNANLSEAELSYSRLMDANLVGANLRRAHLIQAFLMGAN